MPKLPLPFFPPQAIILSVLLLTPPRRWWLYLLVYYAIQVTQGTWYGMPLWYTLLTNAGNAVTFDGRQRPICSRGTARRSPPHSPDSPACAR